MLFKELSYLRNTRQCFFQPDVPVRIGFYVWVECISTFDVKRKNKHSSSFVYLCLEFMEVFLGKFIIKIYGKKRKFIISTSVLKIK